MYGNITLGKCLTGIVAVRSFWSGLILAKYQNKETRISHRT